MPRIASNCQLLTIDRAAHTRSTANSPSGDPSTTPVTVTTNDSNVGVIRIMAGTLYITGDKAADRLLNTNANALLLGMLLDQQVPMEWAFAGPATLRQRLGHLDAKKIAAMDVEAFVAVCCEKPAIHRFPASMGRRIHDLCVLLTDRVRRQGRQRLEGRRVRRRAVPPLARVARLRRGEVEDLRRDPRQAHGRRAGRLARRGRQVRRRCPSFGRRHRRAESLGKVREWKKAQKAAKKDKQGRTAPA